MMFSNYVKHLFCQGNNLSDNYKLKLLRYQKIFGSLNLPSATLFNNSNFDYKKNPSKIIVKEEKNSAIIDANIYKEIFEKYKFGRLNIIDYKGTLVYLCGANYTHIPNKNIYKMLLYSNPDYIGLKIKPDYILKDFKINIKNPRTEDFSQRLYFKQLFVNGFDITPNITMLKNIVKELKINYEYTGDNSKYKELFNKNKDNYNSKYQYDSLTNELVTVSSIYSSINNKKIILSDIPDITLRQDIIFKLSRYQLEEILKNCVSYIVYNPDLPHYTPLLAAQHMYPDIFLKKSDEYISNLIQYLNLKNYKKLFFFLGTAQADSVKHILEHSKIKNIKNNFNIKEENQLFYKDPTLEEIIEKLSILDVMQYGEYLFTDFENKYFKSTYTLIEHFEDFDEEGRTQQYNNDRINYIRNLHSEFLVKYYKMYKEEYLKNKEKLKLDYIKHINNSYITENN